MRGRRRGQATRRTGAGPIWLRGVASRPVGFLLVVLLSAAACGTAALGPLLVRALEQATLADAVAAAGTTGTQLTVSVRLEPGQAYGPAEEAVDSVFGGVDQGVLPGAAPLWAPVDTTVSSFTDVDWSPGSGTGTSRVVGVASGCGDVVVVDGRCPTATGEVLVSTADASRLRVAPGARLSTTIVDQQTPVLTVVGTYDPAASLPGVLVRPDTPDGAIAQVSADTLVVTRDQLAALRQPATVTAALRLAGGIAVDQVPAVRRTVGAVQGAAATGVPGRVLFADTRLPTLLDETQRQAYEGGVLVGVSVAQALAVAFFALGTVLQRVGRARSREWGLGRLRGIPRGRWLASILLEPGTALVLGLPLGWGLGVLAGRAAVAADLSAGTAVEPWRWPVLGAAVGALVGGLLALGAVVVRAVRRPPVELVQQAVEPRRLAVGAAAAQAGLLVVTGLSVYQLVVAGSLTQGRSRLGLVAPALVALSVAVVVVRVAVLLVRRTTARPPRSRTGLVVGRQLARTPSSLNPAVVVAAGVALTVFVTQVAVLSERNRVLLADATVGAPTVLQVAVPATADLIETVDAVDPSGRQAMAVQEKASSADAGTSRIVAVDSRRFDAITAWSPSWSDAGPIGGSLGAPVADPVYLSGKTVTVSLSDVSGSFRSPSGYGSDPPPAAPPGLSLRVETPRGLWYDIELGDLEPGTTRFKAALREDPSSKPKPYEPRPCLPRCRVVGFGVGGQSDFRSTFTVTGVATDRAPAAASRAWLTAPGWHSRTGDQDGPAYEEGTLGVSTTATGLQVEARDPYGHSALTAVPGDTTDVVPAVLAPRTPLSPFPGKDDVALGTGLDGQAQQLLVVGRAATLPRSLDDGVLVDLRNLQGSSSRIEDEATSEVWLAADAPPSLEQALVDRGLRITGRESLAGARADLARQPTARAAVLSVTVGLAVLALAVLALLAARLADAGARRSSWRSLRQAGVSRAATRRLAVVEIALPALLAVLAGAGSGAAILHLAAPRLPLRDTHAPGPPLELGLAWPTLLAVAAGAALLVGAVAAAAALVETRRAREEP